MRLLNDVLLSLLSWKEGRLSASSEQGGLVAELSLSLALIQGAVLVAIVLELR